MLKADRLDKVFAQLSCQIKYYYEVESKIGLSRMA